MTDNVLLRWEIKAGSANAPLGCGMQVEADLVPRDVAKVAAGGVVPVGISFGARFARMHMTTAA
jgi:hypothetical protein